jgi:hypothetical protein
MPAAKSMRPTGAASASPPASGEKPVGSRSHADFLDAVASGAIRLIGEERRRGNVQLEDGMRRIQYGVTTGERLVLVRWAEDNTGHWHKTELSLPKDLGRALASLVGH